MRYVYTIWFTGLLFSVLFSCAVTRDDCKSKFSPDLHSGVSGTVKYRFGFFSSYDNNANCWWKIEVPFGSVIKLSLTFVDIQICAGCSCDAVEIIDGQSPDDTSLGKSCSNRDPVVSSGNTVYIKFTSDSTLAEDGFEYLYTALQKDEVCPGSGQLDAGDTVRTIQSVNYPNKYLGNLNCTWRFTAPPGYFVKITFDDLQMESCSPECSCDYIEVFDGTDFISDLLGRRCSGHPEFTSTGQIIIVKFKSNPYESRTGFKASYWAIEGYGTTKPNRQPTQRKKKSSGLADWVIAVIVTGIVIVVIFIIVCCYCCRSTSGHSGAAASASSRPTSGPAQRDFVCSQPPTVPIAPTAPTVVYITGTQQQQQPGLAYYDNPPPYITGTQQQQQPGLAYCDNPPPYNPVDDYIRSHPF